MLLCCREFNLSGAHPKTSKQAALERHEQQQQDSNMRPHACSGGRGRSQSVGKQRATGEQRLEQLARPKTAHWDKCECMCVLWRLLCIVMGLPQAPAPRLFLGTEAAFMTPTSIDIFVSFLSPMGLARYRQIWLLCCMLVQIGKSCRNRTAEIGGSTTYMSKEKKKKKNCTIFHQPSRLITCASHALCDRVLLTQAGACKCKQCKQWCSP